MPNFLSLVGRVGIFGLMFVAALLFFSCPSILSTPNEPISRGLLAALPILEPGVYPDLWGYNSEGPAFLPTLFPPLLFVSVLFSFAWGIGALVLWGLRLRHILRTKEFFFFAVTVGLATISLSLALFAWYGLERNVSLFLFSFLFGLSVLLLGSKILFRRNRREKLQAGRFCPLPRWSLGGYFLAMMIGALAALYLLAATKPPFEYDMLEYHAQSAREIFETQQLPFFPHNVYLNMPLGAEMFLLLGYGGCGPFAGSEPHGIEWGKTLLAACAILTAFGLYTFGERFFHSQRTGAVAALIYLSSPNNYQTFTLGLNDGVLGLALLATFYAVGLFAQQAEKTGGEGLVRLATLAGICTGFAAAIKYTGVVFIGIPAFVAVGTILVFSPRRALFGEVSFMNQFFRIPRPSEAAVELEALPVRRCGELQKVLKEREETFSKVSSQKNLIKPSTEKSFFSKAFSQKTRENFFQILGKMVNFKLNDSNTPKACEISRRTKIAAIFFFSVAALGVGGFWYAKNVSSTGNPVWPLAYSIFGDATNTWDAAVNARWTAAHSSHEFSLSTFVSSVTAFVARDDFASPMIAVFGILAILALFNPAQNGSRVVRCQMIYIMGYVLFFVAVWWFSTHRLIRFFDPVLPVLSVALAVGITRFAESFRTRAATAVLYAILFFCSWYAVVLNATTGNDLWVPNDRFLAERSRYGDWPVFFQETSQEDGWPSDQKLLLVGEARAFAYRVPLLYSTCWNRSPLRNCLPDSFFARIKEARDNRQTIRFDWTDEEKHEITTRLADEKIALILVDWGELERFNSPGNYGLVDADILCPDFFASLVRVKILEPFFPQEYETFSLRTKEKTTLYKVCEPLVSK